MGATQQFSLRWSNYFQHITGAFDSLRCDEELVDVTLSCEGKKIFAHKMLLSACSSYFKETFKENPCKHPVIIFRNVKFEDLLAIIDFMYHGEVNVEQERLTSFLTTAEMLAVKGLTVATGSNKEENRKRHTASPTATTPQSISIDDLSFGRQNNHKLPSRPLGTQNPPSLTSHIGAKNVRPPSPTVRKRRLSPSSKIASLVKEPLPKLVASAVPESEIVPKVEVDELDEETSLSDQEGLLSESQLILDQDYETEHGIIKVEKVEDEEKAAGVEDVKAGPSAVLEAEGEENEIEEYLEEGEEDNDVDASEMAYIVMGPDGAMEYVDASLLSKQNFIKLLKGNEPDFESLAMDGRLEEEESGVEYIYAEAVTDNNEIVIGSIPKYECEHCPRTFKRLDSLHKHYSVHLGKTTCPICNSVFSRVAHRTRHIKVKHPDSEYAITGRERKKRK